ncbi:MAG: chemotaxis protein MotB [Bacillota bacterium]|nr:MAG: chemotaxis protein MotB [Bacillota bacterium]MBS3951260.1 OmpA family protein [Peptococcaceae bacterium]
MTRRRKASVQQSGNWMITWSDLVTLLLCFFILLYSFSALDVDKFRKFIMSFQGQGMLDGGTVPVNEDPPPVPDDGPSNEASGSFYADSGRLMIHIQEYLKENGIEGHIEVYREEQGVMIEIKDHLFFDSARAEIRSDGRPLLNKLAALLDQMPNDVVVEGHTDNIPIKTLEYPTNWELSAARSARVVRYFTEISGLDPRRFAAMGYGEFRPAVSNATVEGRTHNRRVVLVIKRY